MECKRHCYRTRKFSIKGIKVNIDILPNNFNEISKDSKLNICNSDKFYQKSIKTQRNQQIHLAINAEPNK